MTADAPLVIADAEMLTGDPPRFLERDVVIDAGRIVAITRRGAATAPGAQVVRAPGRALLPGLINAHTHAYGQVCRCVPAKRLEAWLPLARAAASTMTADAHGVAVQLNVLDNLRHGVTTSLDHASLTPEILGETIDGYRRSHARVVLAAQTSDLGPEALLAPPRRERVFGPRRHEVFPSTASAEEAIATTRTLLELTADDDLITAAVGPSAPERCSETLLSALASLADEWRAPVHTHLLETPLQREHDDPIEMLRRVGLLNRRTTVAHGIYLTASDRDRLAAAEVTVAHDPLCNLLLGSGQCDTASLLESGVELAIATDGWATGGAQDVLAQARLALALGRPSLTPRRWISPQQAWRILTRGGSRAVAHEGRLGVLEVGADADVLVVDPARAGWLPGVDAVTQILLGGLGAGLRAVYVAGRELWRDGAALTLDEERLRHEAGRHARRCGSPPATVAAEARRLSELLGSSDGQDETQRR